MNVRYQLVKITTTPIIPTFDARTAAQLAEIADTQVTAAETSANVAATQQKIADDVAALAKALDDPVLGQASIKVSTNVGQPLEVVGI